MTERIKDFVIGVVAVLGVSSIFKSGLRWLLYVANIHGWIAVIGMPATIIVVIMSIRDMSMIGRAVRKELKSKNNQENN